MRDRGKVMGRREAKEQTLADRERSQVISGADIANVQR